MNRASDSLQLSLLETLLRLVRKKPNQWLLGARHRMCYSMPVLQPSTLRRDCTEHKPGYLHAATQWTHTATATLLHLTHMNVTTNVNGMSLYDFYGKSPHFDLVSAPSVPVQYTVCLKKKIHKIVFSWWNVKVSGVNHVSARCCRSEWLSTFSLKHNIGAVIAKNVNLPPRLSYCFLYFSGPTIGHFLVSDNILLMVW